MKILSLILIALLLGSCVHVSMQPPKEEPRTVTKARPYGTCGTYRQPLRKEIPSSPEFLDSQGEYTKFLESMVERLVAHVTVLEDYIDNEHSAQDHAFERYDTSCR